MRKHVTVLEKEVRKQFEGEATGHDWFHIDRVRNLSLQLSEKEGGNKEIIEIASLLHDISDHKFNGGDFKKGGEIARAMLSEIDYPKKETDKIVYIVNHVSFKGSGVPDNMPFLEGKIVQDADRIDALGAIGIARTFAYGGAAQHPIFDPSILPLKKQSQHSYTHNQTHTINHFYEKLLLLEDRMHTKTGRDIAHSRTQFMREFLNQFYQEWGSKNPPFISSNHR